MTILPLSAVAIFQAIEHCGCSDPRAFLLCMLGANRLGTNLQFLRLSCTQVFHSRRHSFPGSGLHPYARALGLSPRSAALAGEGARPPNHVRRYYASFTYQAGSWDRKRRVVAKVEWHPGERVVAFYTHRGTAEQHIKEGKNAIKWTRLSWRGFRNNEVRLQLHALAYNLANFMRTLALPEEVEHWSLTTLREKLVKIGANVVRHGRYITFQLAEVAVPRSLFQQILALIDDLRRRPVPA